MVRPRIAWFSPIAPVRSGISAYTAELLPLLDDEFEIELFVDAGTLPDGMRPPNVWKAESGKAGGRAGSSRQGAAVLGAHAFPSRHALAPFDLIVYQLGNAACHDYMWPYLLRYPGLVVLHDAALHHSRARALLSRGRPDDYRAEFAYAHPGTPPQLAEYAIAGFAGAPYYLWPHARVPIESARLVAVHSEALAATLGAEYPLAAIRPIRMGVRAVSERTQIREPGGPLFACYGHVTPEKRIPQVLAAFVSVLRVAPDARLLLVGEPAAYYDVRDEARQLGILDRLTITGFVPDAALDEWLMAADICVCLRWPTARETSASWLRCLAAGKPTIVTDLAHTTDTPVLDPRTWTLAHTRVDAAAAAAPPGGNQAVAVAIDILDEDHSLDLAFRRLAADAALRGQLGRNARRWWAAHHTLDQMAARYREVIEEAITRPVPPTPDSWPPHLVSDTGSLVSRIAKEFGVTLDV